MIKVDFDREIDGRWIAEVVELPGVLAYGQTKAEAEAKVRSLALRLIADRIDHGEPVPMLDDVFAGST